MTTAQLEEQKQVIETEVLPLAQRTQNLIVRNKEERQTLFLDIKKARELKERIEERFHFSENRDKAHKVWKALKDAENQAYEPIDGFCEAGKKAIDKFDTAEAQKARQEAELAEAKRRDEEAKEKARLEAKAEKELEKGNVAKAEALLEQAEAPKTSVSFSPAPGKTRELVTKANVLNMLKLCKLIVDGEIGINVLEVKEGELNKWAKDKKVTEKFDGIELYEVAAGRI